MTTPRAQSGSLLTLHYRLSGPQGDLINTFGGKPATLTLGTGELAPGVEACLLGLAEGTRTTFDIPAGTAFGEHNPEMRQWVAASLLRELGDPQVGVGDVLQFPTPDGTPGLAGTLLQIGADEGSSDALLFDFNHPLAGQPVQFEVHLIGVL